MKSYCVNCDKETRIIVKEESQESIIKGVKVTSLIKTAFCSRCNQEVYIPSINDANLDTIDYNYREQHNIIHVSEIEELLAKYNIGAKPLSLLLGWGEVTISRYLKGQLPIKEHSDKLKSLNNPYIFLEVLKGNKSILTDVALRKVQASLSTYVEMSQVNENIIPEKCLVEYFYDEPSIYNGYTHFNLKKVINIILFFLNSCGPTYKTKLNKMLWYADMLSFKRSASAITGLKYIRDFYGPVPVRYELLYGSLCDVYISFIDTANGTQLQSIKEHELRCFSESEYNAIKEVSDRLGTLYSSELTKYSHKELGFIETAEKNLISFEYARLLSID